MVTDVEIHQQLVFHGLDWVLAHVPDLVRRARLAYGTNDVLTVIVMSGGPKGKEAFHPYAHPRAEAVDYLRGLFEDSGHGATIKRLEVAPRDPGRAWVCIVQGVTVFSWLHELSGSLQTQSVLN